MIKVRICQEKAANHAFHLCQWLSSMKTPKLGWFSLLRGLVFHAAKNSRMISLHQRTKRQSIVKYVYLASLSWFSKQQTARTAHSCKAQLKHSSFTTHPLAPWFEKNQEWNKRAAHQKVFQMGLIHVKDQMKERFLSYRHEILSFHRNRYIDSTVFRDAQKSGHGEGIFKTVCNV